MSRRLRFPARAAALALLIALLGGACRDEGADPAASRPRASSPAGAPRPGALDPRTQYDLAGALAQVERARGADRARAGYEQIRASWTGRRFRWRVRVVAPLCRSRDACNVLPFDRAGRDKAIVQGWMPRLDLDEAAFAAIQRACAAQPACQVDVEGTLSRFVLDPENPISLEFSQIRVL